MPAPGSLAPRLVSIGTALAAITAVAYPAVVGWQFADNLMAPAPFDRPDTPERYKLPYEAVEVPSARTGATLKGWFFENPKSEDKAVLFLHGWRSHKRHMLKDYLSWLARRYTVLAFDHPGHGDSPPGVTTLGDREREDAASALAMLVARGYTRIGVLGTSMGGTTAIGLATLLVMNGRTGRDLAEAGAERAIARLAPRPVFLIHGDADHVILPDNARRLYAAARMPKTLWVVPGADHMSEDGRSPHALQPIEYERRVGGFFDRHL